MLDRLSASVCRRLLRVCRLWEDDPGMRAAEGVLINSNETREQVKNSAMEKSWLFQAGAGLELVAASI